MSSTKYIIVRETGFVNEVDFSGFANKIDIMMEIVYNVVRLGYALCTKRHNQKYIQGGHLLCSKKGEQN